jgi:molecular chaperone GrpE
MKNENVGPVSKLRQEAERLEREGKALKEEYLRALADFDNYRRRVERDIDTSRRAALEALVVELLPVLDNFDRAAQASSSTATDDSVRKGLELIHRQLRDVLARHGLCEYSCLGQEFDPRRAEAIGHVPAGAHAPNTVVTEACKGYECGGRVLRPARVIVAKSAEPATVEPDARTDEPGEAVE